MAGCFKLLKALDEKYQTIVEVERNRVRFNRRHQRENETKRDFMDELKILRKRGWPSEGGSWKESVEAKTAIARQFFHGVADAQNYTYIQSVLRICVPITNRNYLEMIMQEVEREDLARMEGVKSESATTRSTGRRSVHGEELTPITESTDEQEERDAGGQATQQLKLIQSQAICHGCGGRGHYRRQCSQLDNQLIQPRDSDPRNVESIPWLPERVPRREQPRGVVIARLQELCVLISRMAMDVDNLKQGLAGNTERLAKIEAEQSTITGSMPELDEDGGPKALHLRQTRKRGGSSVRARRPILTLIPLGEKRPRHSRMFNM